MIEVVHDFIYKKIPKLKSYGSIVCIRSCRVCIINSNLGVYVCTTSLHETFGKFATLPKRIPGVAWPQQQSTAESSVPGSGVPGPPKYQSKQDIYPKAKCT